MTTTTSTTGLAHWKAVPVGAALSGKNRRRTICSTVTTPRALRRHAERIAQLCDSTNQR